MFSIYLPITLYLSISLSLLDQSIVPSIYGSINRPIDLSIFQSRSMLSHAFPWWLHSQVARGFCGNIAPSWTRPSKDFELRLLGCGNSTKIKDIVSPSIVLRRFHHQTWLPQSTSHLQVSSPCYETPQCCDRRPWAELSRGLLAFHKKPAIKAGSEQKSKLQLASVYFRDRKTRSKPRFLSQDVSRATKTNLT